MSARLPGPPVGNGDPVPPFVPHSRCPSCSRKMISAFPVPTCRNPVRYIPHHCGCLELFRQLAQVVDEGRPDMTFLADGDGP